MKAFRSRNAPFYGWIIVGTTFFMSFLGVGSRNGFGLFFKPWQEEFGWSVSTISAVAAIGTVVNGLTQPLIGRLYDRFGGRKVILASLTVFGLGTVGLSLVNSIWLLLLIYGLVISFAAGGISFVATGPLIARWFKRRRGSAMAIQTAGGPVGGMLVVPFTLYVMLLTNWRASWLVLGLLILLIGLPLAWLLLKEDPKDIGLEPDGGNGNEKDGTPRKPPEPRRPGPLECDAWKQAFRSPPIWQLSAAYFVCGVTTTVLGVHFVPFATDRGMSPGMAATAFGFMSGLNVVGVLLVGFVSDRLGRKDLLAGVYFVRGLGYLMLVLIPGVSSIWAFAAIAGMSWIATVPLTYSLTGEVYGIKNMGTLSGIVTMSHQLGGALSIFLAGYSFDRFGSYLPAWGVAAVALGIAALLSFSVRERALSSRYQPVMSPSPAAGS
ncbi:MAG: MFS transporter [Chloroflexi bacterium]|nr:MFS transporter [Chloroflexota bacterium]